MQFDFACHFLEDTTILCRDLPGAVSCPDEGDTCEKWAELVVVDWLDFLMWDDEPIPVASPAEEGEYVVRLTLTQTAKIVLHNARLEANVSKAELAERTGMSLGYVERMLNFRQSTKIESIREALRSLGKDFTLGAVDL
ncbi:type II toxin-antitoxin system HicB family antitoxin [Sutterella megalosphaeroides]|uniref:HTH cro/C1-type domain-containing protein n=1 Tax=Sutterella megalosphaeroides TaxID=2494234 RepID=A0A2Z6IBN4_9BURK|nr:type II toxin-antitoxin system HicB family antitoxin [Sutterella megalosphaeroides]BBF23702.1 hypothetical protein SUTMEG_15930 [Sutterella megalosphaeroides]